MDILLILRYLQNPGLPIVILVVCLTILYRILKREQQKHDATRKRLDEVHTRLEARLYHELDELEKLLQKERPKK